MRNVTDLFFDYLEAKRHLWNMHFRHKVSSLRESRPLDRYEIIDRLLFAALVLDPLKQAPLEDSIRFGFDPLPRFRVVAKDRVDRVIVRVSEPTEDLNRVWALKTSFSSGDEPLAHREGLESRMHLAAVLRLVGGGAVVEDQGPRITRKPKDEASCSPRRGIGRRNSS